MEQIEQLAIETLTPYKNNARVHSPEQIKQIANSIKEFGFNNGHVCEIQLHLQAYIDKKSSGGHLAYKGARAFDADS